MLHLHSFMVGCMYNFYCILFMSNSLDFFFSYVSWMQYFFLNIFERVGLLDQVGKNRWWPINAFIGFLGYQIYRFSFG